MRSLSNISINPSRGLIVLLAFFLVAGFSLAQVSVTSPSSRDDVKACADYADEVLYDSWDMNERTDLGWRIFNTEELPLSYLSDISFQNGIFSAKSVYKSGGSPNFSDANVSILDSAYMGSAGLGKTGAQYPINANKYTTLVMRMFLGSGSAGPYGQLLWSTNTIYSGSTTSGSFSVHDNWFIYMINITSLGYVAGSDAWSGYIDSLRLDPLIVKDKNIKIDWIRLVEQNGISERDISWNGAAGNVDIYLDNNSNPSDGNLGMLAENVSGSSYSFLAGALAPGDYYVAVAPTGTGSLSYSSGYYNVNDVPIIRMLEPSAKGSDTDYVSISWADPWDMANSEDVEHTVNVNNGQFKTVNYEDLVGNTYNSQSVYYGVSATTTGVGDPRVHFLHFLYRGAQIPINTSRYHNLVFKMGIWGEQSVNDGSIARVIWKLNDESVENVSEDIIIRHLPDKWVMNEIVCDLNDLPIEQGAGSPSHSGWTGEVDSFRIDPHEFSNARSFFFDEVRLTTDCKADMSYAIEWNVSDSDDIPQTSLYYDNNNSGYNGTPIVQNLSSASGDNYYTWNTSSVSEGKYWIYAIVSDGVNQTKSYSSGPVVVDHALVPEISIPRSRINFGVETNGPRTSNESVLITNSGQGTLNWEASADRNWITLSPSSGIGDGTLEIGITQAVPGPGSYTGQVIVSDPDALNSPEYVDIKLTVYASGNNSPPFGNFETPVNNSTVSGSIAVSGWALDDIEVTRIQIKRTPHPDDPPAAIGPDGLIHICDAVFIQGARPDVEAAYPGYPRCDKAGWGSMVLTNFLPNQGNGNFTLHVYAYDAGGHCVKLGQKDIIADNANRVKPFGTIDTPQQAAVISGSEYVNFGWALTPQPKKIPEDGSTIWVWIDGQPLGHPSYGHYRADIATLFPGYQNSDGAVGYFYVDTAQFENGVHNISWSVADDNGDSDGIGLRRYNIQNLGGGQAVEQVNYIEDSSGSLRLEVVGFERGMRHRANRIERLSDDRAHLNLERPQRQIDDSVVIEIEEVERIEIHFKNGMGSKVVGWGSDNQHKLPEGSYLDREKGVFYWHPAPGFLGRHVLHFAVSDGVFISRPQKVVVNIVPRRYPR